MSIGPSGGTSTSNKGIQKVSAGFVGVAEPYTVLVSDFSGSQEMVYVPTPITALGHEPNTKLLGSLAACMIMLCSGSKAAQLVRIC